MTERQAERVANFLIGLAAASAAYQILRDPALRGTAWRAARRAFAAAGPWLISEVRHGWAASAPPPESAASRSVASLSGSPGSGT